ncbi:hypothetical protein ITI46_20735, partial [Streptomyces oryzae]|nr:hypothetical protein [Streptomyces oryzae]
MARRLAGGHTAARLRGGTRGWGRGADAGVARRLSRDGPGVLLRGLMRLLWLVRRLLLMWGPRLGLVWELRLGRL